MRIAISGLASMGFLLTAVNASGQPQPAGEAPPIASPVAPSDVPPKPSPPGSESTTGHPPAPEPSATPFSSEQADQWDVEEELPLAGWHGRFFLRDSEDYFRLYPRARMQLDFHSTFGEGVSDQAPTARLDPRFFVRRLRLEFAGELLKRWSFMMGVDFGGQSVSNQKAANQDFAGPAGENPTADSARFTSVQGASSTAKLANAWVNYSLCPCLNLMFGQYNTPFSMQGRTSQLSVPLMERNVAIRDFLVPTGKEIGLTVWGDIGGKMLSYEVAVVAGDGKNRASVDGAVDFLGRVAVRPLESVDGLEKVSVGVSARHGERDPEGVAYDYPDFKTNQGFTLWDSTYRDSLGRRIHIIPSGAQNQIGGELRVPFWRMDLRGEAYVASHNTRDAVDGFQLSNTERLGRISGVGWYGSLSWWALGDTFISGDPGRFRPTKVNLRKKPKLPRGLELSVEVAGIQAGYEAAARGGALDPGTPGAADDAADINILQYGFGASYWHTKRVRLYANYVIYHTPDSGSAGGGATDNLAAVPGNLGDNADADVHLMHEFGTRISINF